MSRTATAALPAKDDEATMTRVDQLVQRGRGQGHLSLPELRTAFEEAGISAETWFHDYRRAYITNSRRMGIDERTIMRQSGHKTRAAFDRYNIVDDSDQREAVKRYEAALRQESVKVGVPSGK